MKKSLILRTIYIDADLDAELTKEAFNTRTPKATLFVKYLKLGMKIAKREKEASEAKPQ